MIDLILLLYNIGFIKSIESFSLRERGKTRKSKQLKEITPTYANNFSILYSLLRCVIFSLLFQESSALPSVGEIAEGERKEAEKLQISDEKQKTNPCFSDITVMSLTNQQSDVVLVSCCDNQQRVEKRLSHRNII